jgi:hypothetical protein
MVKSHPRIFTYFVHLPDGIREAVMPCADGFTVYISDTLDDVGRIHALSHALRHIKSEDWNKSDVQEIERRCHNDT